MRTAGVRLPDGRLVWADVGDSEVEHLDRAEVLLGESVVEGVIVVIPEQFIGDIAGPQPVLVRREARGTDELPCIRLPGADMPPLGTVLSTELGEGMVIQLDAVNRTVMIAGDDEAKVMLPWPPSG